MLNYIGNWMKCYDVLKCHSIWVNAEAVKQHHSEERGSVCCRCSNPLCPNITHAAAFLGDKTPFTTKIAHIFKLISITRNGLLDQRVLFLNRSHKNALYWAHTSTLGLTLFAPAYFSISRNQRGGGGSSNILGLGGVRVPIFFGNDFPYI